jgi:hypothetical protein
LVKVVVTLRFSTPSAASTPATFNERPGAAATLMAPRVSASKEERIVEENISSLQRRGGWRGRADIRRAAEE